MKKIALIWITAVFCFSVSASAEKIHIGLEDETDISAVVIREDETEEEAEGETEELPMEVSLDTEELLQYPELPTGCESVSLTILLDYLGFDDLDKTTIVDDYLPYSDNFVVGFCGDPYIEQGGGCYAPAIVRAAQNYLDDHDSDMEAEDITGSSREEIYRLLAQEKPVLIWTTIYLSDKSPTEIYNYYEGKEYEWDLNEHCVVLSGYNLWDGTVEVSDPLDGKVIRDAERFWEIYEEMGSMAVVIE